MTETPAVSDGLKATVQRNGFVEALIIVAGTVIAAMIGTTIGPMFGLPPMFAEGAFGGAVLGAWMYAWIKRLHSHKRQLNDADGSGRIEFEPPQRAMITTPPYDEPEEHEVYAIETNPDGDYPIKVWVEDGSGKEQHPYYATAVEFGDEFEVSSKR